MIQKAETTDFLMLQRDFQLSIVSFVSLLAKKRMPCVYLESAIVPHAHLKLLMIFCRFCRFGTKKPTSRHFSLSNSL